MSQASLKRYSAAGILGLHFTPEELFIAQGQRRGRTTYISSLDCIDITEHVLEGGEFNTVTLVPVIHQVLKQHQIRTRKTVISFPVKFPWIRVIDVPSASERELSHIVRLEVERLYLDSTVEKLIDYYPLDGTRGPEGTIPVLSCAIPRNSIAPYVDLMEAAKLDLVGIDLDEVNVLKLAAMQGIDFNDGISVILNFCMNSTDLMVMDNGRLQIWRPATQSKLQFRELLLRRLPAESPLRKELSRLDFRLPSEHLPLVVEHVQELLNEVRRSIEFYLNDIKHSEGNVTKVILAGSGYWPANLPEILSQHLHLPLIDLKFENIRNIVCKSVFAPDFPACGVYAPVVGSVIRGVV